MRTKNDILRNDDQIRSKFGNVIIQKTTNEGKVFRVQNALLDLKPRDLGEVQFLNRKTETLPSRNFTKHWADKLFIHSESINFERLRVANQA